MIQLRAVQPDELSIALSIIDQAKAHLKTQGIDQWQNGYPDSTSLQQDIKLQKGYFLMSDKTAAGYLCIDFQGEPVYDVIDGHWLSDSSYGVIHRLAISDSCRGKGLADHAFLRAESLCRRHSIHSLRIDTKAENQKMLHILEKNGFRCCGTVHYEHGERVAFEKLF